MQKLKALWTEFQYHHLGLLVFLLSLALFGVVLATNIDTDIQLHANAIRTINKDLPANFLYYVIVYAIALFDTDKAPLYLASMFVLAVAVTAKFMITKRFLQSNQPNPANQSSNPAIIWLVSVLMLFSFSLPTANLLTKGWYYLGQIPSNIWHNSTTIFLMPFALLLFIASYEQLIKPSTPRIWIIFLLCVLNIFIKPSFFFVFCIAYPVMLLASFGLTRRFFVNLVPVFLGGIVLLLLYYLIYKLGMVQSDQTASIVIRPFVVWRYFSSNIFFSLLASLAFPIVYFIFYWKESLSNKLVQYSGIAYIIGLVIFCLLQETGRRALHGNFFWQCAVSSYILFLVLSIELVKKGVFSEVKNWKNKLILLAYSVQVVSGIIYLFKALVLRDFG